MDNRNMINRVFSQKILHQIAIKNKSDVVDEAYDFYIQGPKNINVIQKMKSLYNYLKKSYRNEYFYKNTMLNKLLLGRHSVNTTTALSEMPIGKSIADFILLNGKGVVYEIKTELDKLDRLDNQINDYYEVFNYVVVITNDKHLNKVMARYKDTTVGILVLTSRNTLSEVQKPKENNSLLNSKAMYNFLRKEERKRVIAQNHMDVPTYNDFTEYDVLFDVFKEIPMTKLHNNMISELKKRGNMKEYKDEFLAAPTEIKFLLYFAKMTKKD
ncbi:TPA: sce7726 family protein, partial [Staphylococcus aureus]|nr:sce7726 family protein [Staphylococcus aureus]HEH0014115.1 sce7726 family protein [Staphylococcus aureus]HEH2581783.1 sce7726 family protein [Staphylococcus aureus]HEH2598439.1 sce7726 family protein [Staphylococcus aureus]HEH2937936.1 sce7726 family protein [Staphylococcus aureus]